jgi:hypothetical protein
MFLQKIIIERGGKVPKPHSALPGGVDKLSGLDQLRKDEENEIKNEKFKERREEQEECARGEVSVSGQTHSGVLQTTGETLDTKAFFKATGTTGSDQTDLGDYTSSEDSSSDDDSEFVNPYLDPGYKIRDGTLTFKEKQAKAAKEQRARARAARSPPLQHNTYPTEERKYMDYQNITSDLALEFINLDSESRQYFPVNTTPTEVPIALVGRANEHGEVQGLRAQETLLLMMA